MVMTDIIELMSDLSPSQRHELGIGREVTYPMLWHAVHKIARILGSGGLAITGSRNILTVEQFSDRLLAASVPPTHQLPASIAIDGTDLETWARRRSWASKRSLPEAGTEIPAGTVLSPDKPVNEQGWPRAGSDGRPQNSLDPDARDGYRSGHNGRPGDIYIGFELHLATILPTVGGEPVPHLIAGMTLTPAGSHRGHAAVRTIDGMTATGHEIAELCADRCYTFCKAETFVLPMWARNIDVWATCTSTSAASGPDQSPALSGSTEPCSAKRCRSRCGSWTYPDSSPPPRKP